MHMMTKIFIKNKKEILAGSSAGPHEEINGGFFVSCFGATSGIHACALRMKFPNHGITREPDPM